MTYRMQNSHLITILRTFSKKDFRDLRKWLSSPMHNQREDVIGMFEYLTANGRIDNEKQLRKEKVFQKIFPKEPYDDSKIRQTMHFLFKSVEEFLIYQELREDQVRSKMALASVYRKRKLDKAFQKTIKGVKELQEKVVFRNEHFLRNEYLLQQEQYTYLENQKRNISMNLQEVSDSLDTTYFADKLRQSCLMLAHQKVYKAEYQIGLLKEVLEYVEKRSFLEIPAISIYYYGYRALTSEDNEHFFKSLREAIDQHGHLFPKSEIRDIYLMAINYCIGRANSGGETYIREAFELFRLGFDNKALIENGLVSRFSFRNAVGAGLKLKEYDWVDRFIHEFKQYLEKKYQESFFLHSLARLQFERKDYDQAMKLLVQTDFDDILVNLNAKTMLFKMYYELDEHDALESLLESMRTYILRKNLMGYHKTNYQNIIKCTKRLVRVTPYNTQQKEKLRDEIQAMKPLTEKEWLLEQLETV